MPSLQTVSDSSSESDASEDADVSSEDWDVPIHPLPGITAVQLTIEEDARAAHTDHVRQQRAFRGRVEVLGLSGSCTTGVQLKIVLLASMMRTLPRLTRTPATSSKTNAISVAYNLAAWYPIDKTLVRKCGLEESHMEGTKRVDI